MSKRIAAIMPIFLSPLTVPAHFAMGRADLATKVVLTHQDLDMIRTAVIRQVSAASTGSHWFPQQPDRAELWVDDVSCRRTGECCRNPVRNAWRGFLNPACRPVTAPSRASPTRISPMNFTSEVKNGARLERGDPLGP